MAPVAKHTTPLDRSVSRRFDGTGCSITPPNDTFGRITRLTRAVGFEGLEIDDLPARETSPRSRCSTPPRPPWRRKR